MRHARLSPLGDQAEGRLVSLERPSRDGPRHSGQSLALRARVPTIVPAQIRARVASRRRVMNMVGSPGNRASGVGHTLLSVCRWAAARRDGRFGTLALVCAAALPGIWTQPLGYEGVTCVVIEPFTCGATAAARARSQRHESRSADPCFLPSGRRRRAAEARARRRVRQIPRGLIDEPRDLLHLR